MKKWELFGWQMHNDRKANYASKITHPLFFRNKTRTLDEEKNKCALMMIIFDATPWRY